MENYVFRFQVYHRCVSLITICTFSKIGDKLNSRWMRKRLHMAYASFSWQEIMIRVETCDFQSCIERCNRRAGLRDINVKETFGNLINYIQDITKRVLMVYRLQLRSKIENELFTVFRMRFFRRKKIKGQRTDKSSRGK